jgi:hypothetical protein
LIWFLVEGKLPSQIGIKVLNESFLMFLFHIFFEDNGDVESIGELSEVTRDFSSKDQLFLNGPFIPLESDIAENAIKMDEE